MTRYIESKPNGDGTFDHKEVRAAVDSGASYQYSDYQGNWWPTDGISDWFYNIKYRASVPDTYGIHESSSTLREVKGDAGPAVAEMLLDRIKELEEALQTLVSRIEYYSSLSEEDRVNIEQWEYTEGSSDMSKARAALNKEQK